MTKDTVSPPTYIFDVDGTLADVSHRLWVLEDKTRPRPNWDLFFNMAIDDKPFPHMRQLATDLAAIDPEDGEPTNVIIYCSGRPERLRQLTLTWLLRHGFPVPDALYMRRDGDHRPDNIIKLELYQQMHGDGYKPTMVFDDRNSVVKMWRENGVPCAQVAEGDF